ncbi:uncharacterized protein LOC109807603 isoform X2 [Cajanus cajan]|uniref:uncharacterized protein LOC109807603 isoform X2 n=1 Tax=Cajanus cajan TaxID=3821 RepID=UPI0010FB2554|nr:uncharacterized protein LOC109807603 isoform X2 [Cajanus cajan]
MVSARSTTFLLLFILLPLRFSTAHQGKKKLVVSKHETARSPVNVEIYHGFAETDQRTKFLHGRKMVSRGVLSRSNVVKAENGINMAKGFTTKWNHEEGKGILNVKHKVSKKNSGHSTKVKMSGLVPLNADYYVPRPHPPKNN